MASDGIGMAAGSPNSGEPSGGSVYSLRQRPAEDVRVAYARDLAQLFNEEAKSDERQGPFHPVLIFGTRASGKSLALASLLNYARHSIDSHISVRLVDFNYPKSCPNPDELRDWARELYNGEISRFQKDPRQVLLGTRRDYPFFVPVQTAFLPEGKTARGKEEIARFAFLESMGEWLRKEKDDYSFQDLRPEISAVLEHFNAPLSAIFVAPATSDEVLDNDDVNESHEALAHCMDEYETKLRRQPAFVGD
jgi:hypothetical protein